MMGRGNHIFGILETRKNSHFGTSLMLANIVGQVSSPTPKYVNGSFAAIFENHDVLFEFARKLTQLKVTNNASSPGEDTSEIRGSSHKK